jgi:hypothetical protein
LLGRGRAQQALQLHHVAGKVFLGLHAVAAQRTHGGAIGAGGAAQAQVDAARVQLGQRAEGFGDDQGRMVGQHDAARAHTDLEVPPAIWPISTAVAELAMPGMLWCSASQ